MQPGLTTERPKAGSLTHRGAARLRARLAGARWIVGAAAVAIFAAIVGGREQPWVAAAGFALVVAAVAFAPRGRTGQASGVRAVTSGADDLGALSALDLAAAVPDPLLIFDRNGTLLFANPAAAVAFGELPRGTLLPLRFRAPEMQQLITSVVTDARAMAIDHVERVPLERAYRVTASPAGRQGDVFMMLFKDQSETRRIDRMRADFIANASHELRTPLASVAGFIETLKGPARNDEKARDQFLDIMQTQTDRMARLIDDLLSLSRIEMKPYARSDRKIDLVRVVDGVMQSLEHLAKDNAVTITLARPHEPVLVHGSEDELIQVFQNLLENACKYGSSGGRVDIGFERQEVGGKQEVAVTIRDYGPGIPEAHIPRVTERFYRVDVDKSRTQKGTGLGLSIVKHILTRHDGRLSIRSRIGEGAAFTVHLPSD